LSAQHGLVIVAHRHFIRYHTSAYEAVAGADAVVLVT
jgi:hypothetical protein